MKFLSVVFLVMFSYALEAKELLRTTTTWEGDGIVYPVGEPEVTSIKLSLEEGETTVFHCHPVPTFGYVLKGVVEVETKTGRKIVFKKGESVVEVLKTIHRGKAIGGPVEIVVFYAGEKSTPNTVLSDSELSLEYCKD